jgi:riboflavin kinase / FMN adenylyltransferase
MKIYHHIDEFTPLNNAVVTIGTFDGVHVGHQKIISRLLEVSRIGEGESVILTFFPHPRMILHPEDENIKLINTIREKAELLEKLGVDHLIITPFTRDFSNLSPESYIKEVLVDKIGTRQIVIGYDHHFGKDRQGGFKDLQNYSGAYSFGVEEIPEQDIHDVAVSSTKIRNSLLAGDVKTASDFLGYPFPLTGKVIKGDQIGRKMGFPTANLFIEETYKLIPADGIYAVSVELEGRIEDGNRKSEDGKRESGNGKQKSEDGEQPPISPKESFRTNIQLPTSNFQPLKGMAYIGHRPTLNGMTRNIEVNIFDFDSDIYGATIRLNFLHFIRGDQKFDSLDELKDQIARDEITARKLLN